MRTDRKVSKLRLLLLFTDIDECVAGEDNCHAAHSVCSDEIGGQGSFQCSCQPGYTGNGVDSCENIDECSLGLDTCDDATTDCSDTEGGFMCICKDGFVSDGMGSCIYGKCYSTVYSGINRDDVPLYECIIILLG